MASIVDGVYLFCFVYLLFIFNHIESNFHFDSKLNYN